MDYETIKENLNNITHAIDAIAESNLRRYIDSQVTIIHRKMQGMRTGDVELEADQYRRRMEE